jgi:hypothetical protein
MYRSVHPFDVYFTHDRISPAFRNGIRVDDAIRRIRDEEMSAKEFPAMDVVQFREKMFSLSNRRLFVFRVLAQMGIVERVEVLVHPFESDVVQSQTYDRRLGRSASKWDRSFSTKCDGMQVQVRSEYANYQTRCPMREGFLYSKLLNPFF